MVSMLYSRLEAGAVKAGVCFGLRSRLVPVFVLCWEMMRFPFMLLFILSCGCPLARSCGCLCHMNISFSWGDKVV